MRDSGRRQRLATLTGRVVALALGVPLLGCSSVELSPDARRAIHTVSVHEEVDEIASYSGDLPGAQITTRGSVWYAGIITAPVGIVYDIIDWSETEERRSKALRALFEEAAVDVGAIVREQFVSALEERKPFAAGGHEGADAQFQLTASYGLSDGLGVRGSWKSYLMVEGVLVNRAGEVLWQRSASVGEGDRRTPELEAPFTIPERLRGAFRLAATIVIAELMEHLAPSG